MRTRDLVAERRAASEAMKRLEAIFRLGGLRSIFELIEELIRHGLIAEAELDWRLATYVELDPRALKIGGDCLPRLPIRAVGGR
jgi:hypothetical protein